MTTYQVQLAASFLEGQRVELHPATDWFMRGARYGTVVGVFRQWVRVELDTRPDRPVHIAPQNLTVVED